MSGVGNTLSALVLSISPLLFAAATTVPAAPQQMKVAGGFQLQLAVDSELSRARFQQFATGIGRK